jgi:hypothetical protein
MRDNRDKQGEMAAKRLNGVDPEDGKVIGVI